MNVAVSEQTSPHGVRLTVRDFLLLAESGAFDRYSKSELLDGEIVCVNAQHNRHAMAKTDLLYALIVALKELGSPLRATVEVSVELDEYNLPEPDIAVTSYRGRGNVPGDTVAILVEVAETTLDHDMNRKLSLYAAGDIPEYWVLDIVGEELHQFWAPDAGAYRQRRATPLPARAEAATIAGLAVSIDA